MDQLKRFHLLLFFVPRGSRAAWVYERLLEALAFANDTRMTSRDVSENS